MEEQVGAKILHFKAMLRRRYLSTEKELKAVDLAHLTLYFTLDVITQLVFGKAFGFMDAEDDLYAYSTTMDALGFPITIAAEVPWLRRLSMSFLGASFRPKMSDKTGLGKAMKYVPIARSLEHTSQHGHESLRPLADKTSSTPQCWPRDHRGSV